MERLGSVDGLHDGAGVRVAVAALELQLRRGRSARGDGGDRRDPGGNPVQSSEGSVGVVAGTQQGEHAKAHRIGRRLSLARRRQEAAGAEFVSKQPAEQAADRRAQHGHRGASDEHFSAVV